MNGNKHNDGGPAFPGRCPDKELRQALIEQRHLNGLGLLEIEKLTAFCPGMSLRDWFAGMALQGMLANGFMPNQDYTRAAFKLADNALKAREL